MAQIDSQSIKWTNSGIDLVSSSTFIVDRPSPSQRRRGGSVIIRRWPIFLYSKGSTTIYQPQKEPVLFMDPIVLSRFLGGSLLCSALAYSRWRSTRNRASCCHWLYPLFYWADPILRSKLFCGIWVIFNLILLVLFEVLHQASLVQSLLAVGSTLVDQQWGARRWWLWQRLQGYPDGRFQSIKSSKTLGYPRRGTVLLETEPAWRKVHTFGGASTGRNSRR